MERIIALAVLGLPFTASAKEPSVILPHVDAGGTVSWTAMIDAATVKTFVDAGGGTNREGRQTQALGRWLDEHLAAVSWCKQGWRFRTEDPKYIEEFGDGRLRVLGICHPTEPTAHDARKVRESPVG